MLKVIKENTYIVNKQIGNLSREVESIQKNQMEIWELEMYYLKIVNWMKLTADWGDIRISALEDKSIESIQSQEQSEGGGRERVKKQ